MKIAISGNMGAGKTTFLEYFFAECQAGGLQTVQLKIADPLYEINKLLGVGKNREFMEGMGTLVRKCFGQDFLINLMEKRVAEIEAAGVIQVIGNDDIRTAGEVELFHRLGFQLIRIEALETFRRNRLEELGTWGSGNPMLERALDDFPWQQYGTIILDNNGELDDLKAKASEVVFQLT